MFVRWQQYKSQALNPILRERREDRSRLRAILVESVRIDGKPRHRHIAFLGSTSVDGRDRLRFWYAVTRKLNQLDLAPKDRRRIETTIAARVGEQPTKAQLRKFDIERKKPSALT